MMIDEETAEVNIRERVILNEYFSDDREGYLSAEKRIRRGEPIEYIVGETVFFDEYYYVTPDVLIPRADTERVVEKVISFLGKGDRFADLCTGSGCIAVSSLVHSENTSAVMVDISERALDVAIRNTVRNNVRDRCDFICLSLEELSFPDDSFDIIVSNPPYIRSGVIDTLGKGIGYEPRIALDGGEDGLYFYRLILKKFGKALKKNGRFIFEIGFDQGNDIAVLAGQYAFSAQIYKDYGKNDRVAVLERIGI